MIQSVIWCYNITIKRTVYCPKRIGVPLLNENRTMCLVRWPYYVLERDEWRSVVVSSTKQWHCEIKLGRQPVDCLSITTRVKHQRNGLYPLNSTQTHFLLQDIVFWIDTERSSSSIPTRFDFILSSRKAGNTKRLAPNQLIALQQISTLL